MMFTSLIYQFAIAWIGAFIVKIIGDTIFTNTSGSMIEVVIGGAILLASAIILLRMFNKKSSGCSGCSNCSGCPSQTACSCQEVENTENIT